MKDQQIIDILREHDAVFLDETTYFDGQIIPNLKILDSKGERVELPDGVHINHVRAVLERHGALTEVGLTPTARSNFDTTSEKLDNPKLMNFEVSEIHSELSDLSNSCVRRKISAVRHGNDIQTDMLTKKQRRELFATCKRFTDYDIWWNGEEYKVEDTGYRCRSIHDLCWYCEVYVCDDEPEQGPSIVRKSRNNL